MSGRKQKEMKLIRFVAFLFYRYYSGGRRPETIPLFHALCSITLLASFHVVQILILLNRVDVILTKPADNHWQQKLGIAAVFIAIFVVFSLIIKRKHMEELEERYQYEWDKIVNANVWLIVYIIMSFALIIVLALWKNHRL
jgi:hypothetical protein